MKKSNKKIPKTHLPKYLYGDEVPMNQQSSYNPNVNPMYRTNDSGMGPNGQADAYRAPSATNEGTQNIYNQNRAKSNMLGTNQKLTGNQYAQMGNAVTQGAIGAYQTSQTPGLSEYEKNQKYGNSIKATETGVVSAINPIFGMIHSGVTAATAPLTAKATQTDEQGNLKNKNFAKADIIGQGFADPMAMIPTMISNKFSMKKYINSVEDNAKGKIAAQKAQEDAYAQQQTDYQNQQQSMMDAAFARGYANQNQTGGNTYVQYAKYGGQMKYAMGGMNMQPNAEVEDNEMITSNTPPQVFANGGVELASNNPYGTPTYKTNGASHENGGIPMNMAPGSIVNGKTKNPLTGNKFTKDIDILAKQENKFTKKAEAGDKYSKINAKLILPILAQKKDYLNNLQNAIIANNEQRKALNRGELPQAPIDNEQIEPQGKMPMGGVQLPYYNTDNAGNPIYEMGGGYPAMTNPYNNFKGSIPMYPDGGVNAQGLTKPQYEQAQRDSMTLYKSGFGKVPNYKFPGFNDAQGRLTEISGIGTGETTIPKSLQGGTGTMSQGSNDFSNIEQYQKPLGLPWKEYIPATEKSGVSIKNTNPSTSYQILRDNSRKITYKDGTTKIVKPGEFKYGGQMPKFLAGGESDDLTPEQQYTKTRFMGAEQNQKNLAFNQMTGNTNPGYSTYNSDYEKALQQTRDEVNAQQNKINPPQEEELQLANDVIDKQHGWNRNDLSTRPKSKSKSKTDPNDKNFDWGNLAMNVGNFAAQNVGNLYNLSRYNKPEVERYERAKATLLDPTAAIRNAMEQTRRAEYNVRGASGGNAGTYLANRVGLNAQNINTVDAIRQQYANANAGISNNFAQYNNQLAMQEVLANAQNRARYRSGKGEAISQIGKNYNQMALDTKKGKMDKSMMEMMPKLINNPEFQKFYTEWMKNNAGSSVV